MMTIYLDLEDDLGLIECIVADQATADRLGKYTIDAGDALRDRGAMANVPELVEALQQLVVNPHGCALCDYGTPRSAAKGHQPDCEYEAARAAIAKVRSEASSPSPQPNSAEKA